MKIKEDLFKLIVLLLIAVFLIMNFSTTIFANDDYYISLVLLTVRAGDNIMEQDDFFQIIDHNEYILIPLLSLSSYLEIELDYKRESEELFVYNSQKDEVVAIDFQLNNYPDFPEWNVEPPLMLEGDFFVSEKLIEYLTDVDLQWSSLKQELILDFADYKDKTDQDDETKIKEKPDKKSIKADVKGANFSFGSLHYDTEFNYSIEDLKDIDNGDLKSSNSFYLHGRAGDWALSSGINLIYNFKDENYALNYPLIRAINKENNRFIILGDSSIDFEKTVDDLNTRGIYFQYPQIKLNKDKSYVSIIGEAKEGSTIKLYLNQKLLLERYIYKGENTYNFTSVPLENNRTNELKIVIEEVTGKRREIVKKIPGSNYIFEDKKNQTIFVIGKSKESSEGNWENDIIAFQQDYGLNNNNSLSWELAAQREIIEDEEIMNIGSLVRFAHRTNNLPTVTNVDWLLGGKKDNLENGVSSRVMYTLTDGYFATKIDYIPPEISDYVDVPAGGRASFDLQHEIGKSWLFDLNASNTNSIKDMADLKAYQGGLAFSYLDQLNNSFALGANYGKQEHRLIWEQINYVETMRDWTSLNLKGRKNIKDINLKLSTFYENNQITFENVSNSAKLEKGEVNLDMNSRLSKNIILGFSIDSKGNWFENKLQEQNLFFDGKARYNSGNNFITLGGLSERTKNNSGDDEFQENRREIFLNARRFNYPNLSLFGEIKNTYLYLIDEDYYSVSTGMNYNSDNMWGVDLELDYITPITLRNTPQEILKFKLTKEFDSGLEAYISMDRDYLSFYQKEPSYLISVGFNQSLNFIKSNISGEKYTGGRHHSYIGGIVYLDQKGTGVRNQNDPLLSDISVFRDGTKAVTDKNGEFKFQNVRSGLHEVGIDLNELDAKYNVLTENKIVKIRDNENIFLEFGLTMYGSVSGRVFLDKKLTGSKDPEDEFISMIGFKILELNKTVYSNQEGSFDFSEIPLGKYTLKVLTDTIPTGMKLAKKDTFEINITKDVLDIKDLDIRLIYKVE